ncbi:hypothetical protein TNIN_188951, partial [Trichonephila inaurata madagascariensis]
VALQICKQRKCHLKIGRSAKCGKTYPAFIKSVREQHEEAIKTTAKYQSVYVGH